MARWVLCRRVGATSNMTIRQSFLGVALGAALALICTPAAHAAPVQTIDHTQQFRDAGVNIENLLAVEIGGIVVLRGRTGEAAMAELAGTKAQMLGYKRVANLIEVIELPDDAAIERSAERQLAMARALDGCSFHIDSDKGVLRVEGRVNYELQKDVAMGVLRNIRGVRELKADLRR
jgi:osmotically-inducible protein OsmY